PKAVRAEKTMVAGTGAAQNFSGSERKRRSPVPVEGKMIAHGIYIEWDTLTEERKMSDGVENSKMSVVTTANFDFSQKVKIYRDAEGEQISLLEDPQKIITGTMSRTESIDSSGPSNSMTVHGSESGPINKNGRVTVFTKFGGWAVNPEI